MIDDVDTLRRALSTAHIAMGGDGKWRSTGLLPPRSGDLAQDVPQMVIDLVARLDAIEDTKLAKAA